MATKKTANAAPASKLLEEMEADAEVSAKTPRDSSKLITDQVELVMTEATNQLWDWLKTDPTIADYLSNSVITDPPDSFIRRLSVQVATQVGQSVQPTKARPAPAKYPPRVPSKYDLEQRERRDRLDKTFESTQSLASIANEDRARDVRELTPHPEPDAPA